MTELTVMAERLLRLERENRRLKGICVVVLGGLVALVLMGQAAPAGRVVEAERFVVRNQGGKMLAELGVVDEVAKLIFYDEAGRSRIRLFVQKEAVHLFFVDEADRSRLRLHLGSDTAKLLLADPADRDRVVLGVAADGRPGLVFKDERSSRVVLGHGDLEGTGASEQRPISSLLLFDEQGGVIWRAP